MQGQLEVMKGIISSFLQDSKDGKKKLLEWFLIKVHEIPFESSMEIEGFMVETIRADHPVPAVSYKIIEKDLVKIQKT